MGANDRSPTRWRASQGSPSSPIVEVTSVSEGTGALRSLEALVSVIVVTWNSEPDLGRCLSSLAVEGSSVPLEVICVDNASEDRSLDVARGHGALAIERRQNLGFAAAVNVGLSRVTAPFVLLLNPDVILDGSTVRRCVDVLLEDPDVGVVGCNLRLPDGTPDRASARRFRSLSALAVEAFGLTRLSPWFDFQYFPRWARRDSRDVPCLHGAFLLLRTDLLRSLGGLDESVFMYLEDMELCRQARARGWRVHFVAEAGGVHLLSASTARATPERRALAYLHRLDADIEFIRRTRGGAGRLGALILLAVRALAGLASARLRRRGDLSMRYRMALGWLAGQALGRRPPPAIS